MKTAKFLLLVVAISALPLAAQTNTFPASGSVGIGTTGPSHQLVVGDDLGVIATSKGTITAANSAGNGNLILGKDATHWGIVSYDGTNSLLSVGNRGAQAAININTSGNVGIGTATPNQELSVAGNLSLGTTGSYIMMGYSAYTGGGGYIFLKSTGDYGRDFSLYNYSNANGWTANLFVAGESGNVGIGTTTPQARLSLVNASGVTLQLDKPTGASIQFSRNGTNGYQIDDSSGAMRWLSADATEKMRLDASGNLGIGTPNPTQKLSVNGSIRAKEVIVDTGWSDYVFDAGYKLKALSETEAYIKAEHHLPGIPSAQEVAEHGVTLGGMQSKLLAKIEELTLHQIEQEKRLNEAYGRLQKIETENTALRATSAQFASKNPSTSLTK